MLSTGRFDIGSFPVHNNDPTTPKLNKPLPRAPLRAQHRQNLASSVESFLETDIPSSSLYHDPDIDRWMSPTRSFQQSRREILSYASTYRERSPVFDVGTDRDSLGSTYDDFYDDLSVDRDYMHHPNQEPENQTLRPTSVLPATQLEYRPCSDNSSTLYSAPLHPSSWSANYSALPSSNLFTPPSSPNQSHAVQQSRSFAKRGVSPLEVERLRDELDGEILAYESSRCSSEAQPSTPASSLLPSLSFSSSTGSSPSSIMTYTSSQDIAQGYATVANVERPKGRETGVPPMPLVLADTQSRVNARARIISSPIPSPKFQDVNSAAAASFYRKPSARNFAPTPFPAPTLPAEVSKFDDSDDEDGLFFHHVKKIKSAASLQNLHSRSRARAESASRNPPPIPSASVLNTDSPNNGIVQFKSKGGVELRISKEPNKSNNSTILAATPTSPPMFRITSSGAAQTSYFSTTSQHVGASPEAKAVPPIGNLQKKKSSRSGRSDSTNSASSAATSPRNTPVSTLPKSISTMDRRSSRVSWYSCFSHAPNTEETIDFMAQQKSKSSINTCKKNIKTSFPGKVRVLFKRILRLQE